MAPQAHEIGKRLVAELAAKGECDFVTDFAMRLPTEIFLTIIGVPGSDADLFVPWVEDFFAGFGGDLEQQQAMGAALGGIRQYWVDVLEARRGEPLPGERLRLAADAQHRGRRAARRRPDPGHPDRARAGRAWTPPAGSSDTSSATWRRTRRTDSRLIAEPELIPSAVEESLRLYTIIFGDGRKVAQDTEFHGCPLRKGDMVYGLVSGANRDPRVYDQPDEFIVTARPTTTSASRAARTAASALTWPGWSCRSPSRSGCRSSRTSSWRPRSR